MAKLEAKPVAKPAPKSETGLTKVRVKVSTRAGFAGAFSGGKFWKEGNTSAVVTNDELERLRAHDEKGLLMLHELGPATAADADSVVEVDDDDQDDDDEELTPAPAAPSQAQVDEQKRAAAIEAEAAKKQAQKK
jgi:hypothetical protein